LTLLITGRDKKDGYHYIRSMFDPVSLYDLLDIEALPEPAIILEDALGRLKIRPEKNLAYRAAALLQRHARVKYGAKITLYKHIPDGAGLGGGSSDAAAVLKALNTLWGLDLGLNKLKKLAVKLGSDVPFFLYSKPSFVTGKGEAVRPVKRRKILWYLIVVKKGVKVATRDAYKWYDRDLRLTLSKNYTKLLPKAVPAQMPRAGAIKPVNDFETPVFKRVKKLKEVKEILLRCKKSQGVSLSGSGAAVFSLFETKDRAIGCFRATRKFFKGSFMRLAHSI
jgi:4-diphosphocytidyl-2-C-methyl-D-erythritol kinase